MTDTYSTWSPYVPCLSRRAQSGRRTSFGRRVWFNKSHIFSVQFTKKIQQDATVYQNFLFHIYMKLSMFRATHRPSSGA